MLTLGSVIWGVEDMDRAADFWTKALRCEVKYKSPEGDWAILLPEGGVQFCLAKVSSPHARRHHIDLFADDQKAEVERLLALGATRKIWNYGVDADYVVLQDTEGNPFCVVQR